MFDFKFDWQPEMDTHIKDMDTQHRLLFKIGRDMEQLLRIKCIGVTDAQLLDIILQLRDFTGYHFYEEEKLMEEINYPKLKEHRQKHLKYAKYVMDINLPKLRENPEKGLKEIKDEIQGWIFSHMLHDDKEFAQAYLNYRQNESSGNTGDVSESKKPTYVDGFGYETCSLEVSHIYLARNQSRKGHVVVAYKEKARDFARLTALERNIYFGELSKVSTALVKLFGANAADYVSFAVKDKPFCFHVIPKYDHTEGFEADLFDPSKEIVPDEEELINRIEEIKKALNK